MATETLDPEMMAGNLKKKPEEECPCVVARRLVARKRCGEESEFEETPKEIFFKSDAPLIIDSQVLVKIEDHWEPMFGLSSFTEHLKIPVFELLDGDVEVRALYWRPGQETNIHPDLTVFGPGHYGFGTHNSEPDEWWPVTFDVFAFSHPAPYAFEGTWPILGTNNPVGLLTSKLPYQAFEHPPSAEDSYEVCHDAFNESVCQIVRELIGNVVPSDFRFSDLTRFVPEHDRLRAICFRYGPEGRPDGIRLEFNEGGQLDLGFFG